MCDPPIRLPFSITLAAVASWIADDSFTLRRALGKRWCRQQTTGVCFDGYVATLESADRVAIWKAIYADGIPAKVLRLVKAYCRSPRMNVNRNRTSLASAQALGGRPNPLNCSSALLSHEVFIASPGLNDLDCVIVTIIKRTTPPTKNAITTGACFVPVGPGQLPGEWAFQWVSINPHVSSALGHSEEAKNKHLSVAYRLLQVQNAVHRKQTGRQAENFVPLVEWGGWAGGCGGWTDI